MDREWIADKDAAAGNENAALAIDRPIIIQSRRRRMEFLATVLGARSEYETYGRVPDAYDSARVEFNTLLIKEFGE